MRHAVPHWWYESPELRGEALRRGDAPSLVFGPRRRLRVVETRRPRAFVEIDSDGKARVKGWTTEGVVDVTELRVDGPSLVFEAVEFDDTNPLDARVLAQRPE